MNCATLMYKQIHTPINDRQGSIRRSRRVCGPVRTQRSKEKGRQGKGRKTVRRITDRVHTGRLLRVTDKHLLSFLKKMKYVLSLIQDGGCG